MRVTFEKTSVSGEVTVPPSKSMAHRALICAALAQGESTLSNVAFSQDIEATIRALRAFGAKIEPLGGGRVRVRGMGMPRAPRGPVDCGESGSTLRFLIPLAALTGGPVRFVGRGRLMERPQTVYRDLFHDKGIRFTQDAEGITVEGRLRPGDYAVDGDVSSQFITGLLLALSLLDGPSTLSVRPPFESASYVALTLAAMRDFGVPVEQRENTFCINCENKYKQKNIRVEGDWSQAAFFAVLGSIVGGVSVHGLRMDSLQGDRAILSVLERCGARITPLPDGCRFEKSELRGTSIDLADCPDLGPVLMVLGLFCQGGTHIAHARRLRIKESDRIAAMEQEIRTLGGTISSTEDDVYVEKSVLHGGAVYSHNDHRIAMAMAVAALAAGLPLAIEGAEAVRKSYGDFWRDIQALGAEVHTDGTA